MNLQAKESDLMAVSFCEKLYLSSYPCSKRELVDSGQEVFLSLGLAAILYALSELVLFP